MTLKRVSSGLISPPSELQTHVFGCLFGTIFTLIFIPQFHTEHPLRARYCPTQWVGAERDQKVPADTELTFYWSKIGNK